MAILLTSLATQMPAQAIYNETTPLDKFSVEQTIITPYADVIVKKYRDYNGVIQYRRWNQTRGYWVDPYWINA